jgi:hypothetical protein
VKAPTSLRSNTSLDLALNRRRLRSQPPVELEVVPSRQKQRRRGQRRGRSFPHRSIGVACASVCPFAWKPAALKDHLAPLKQPRHGVAAVLGPLLRGQSEKISAGDMPGPIRAPAQPASPGSTVGRRLNDSPVRGASGATRPTRIRLKSHERTGQSSTARGVPSLSRLDQPLSGSRADRCQRSAHPQV